MHLHLIIAVIIITYYVVYTSNDPCVPLPAERPVLLWVDDRRRHPQCPIDTFFDRIVAISRENDEIFVISTGVMVTDRQVLTSFNPYRLLSRGSKQNLTDYIKSTYIRTRLLNRTDHTRGYFVGRNNLMCARQVVPDFDVLPDDDMRHGIHSPLHDLMVFRLTFNVTFVKPVPQRLFTFVYVNKTWNPGERLNEVRNLGPIRTVLAKPGDEFGEEMRLVSAGHRNRYDMKRHQYLFHKIYHFDDKVVTDCEEWFPRQWGHFICVLNNDDFAGIASGAMLFFDDKLFGVGSFALFKGEKGILVFTDVRPYWHLIYQTCTDDDIAGNMPPPPPTTQDPFYPDDPD